MNHLQHLKENTSVFVNFMQQNYPIMKDSNVFFRDLQFAIISYFEMKETPLSYSNAETLTNDFISYLVDKNDLSPLDSKTWRVNTDFGLTKQIEEVEVENE